MNVTSGVNAQTPLLSPSERCNEESPAAEIVEFNAHGNKPRCLICVGTTALFTGIFSGVCSGWICPYISRHLLSLNPLLACCR
ncbi:hypothetical protein WI871_19320, partial [Salmonella enterica subsp. enterica serovar Corvallis]